MADAWDVVGEDAAPKPKVFGSGWEVVDERHGAQAPARSAQDYIFDLATRVRQGTRNVVGGLVGLPVDVANLATEAPRLALRGGNALREAVGLDALPIDIPALQQPDIVQGIRESGNINNAIDAAEHLSPMAEQQAREFQAQDGILPSLAYLAKNPSYAGTEIAAQIPQFLQIAPGSTLGTIALQGASAASQNNQQIGDTMRAEGASEQDIADTLADAYAPSLLGNTVLPSLIPGGAAIERVLAGNAGKELLAAGGSRGRRALVDFLGETGTEGAQEGIDQIVQNLATGHPWNEQVGQNVALGMAIGAPGGLAAGTYEGVTAPERPGAEPAPQANAIDPALLARGNAELQAANKPVPASIADVVPPQEESRWQRPSNDQAAAGSIDELVQRNLPEIIQTIQNNPDVPWAEAARALGLESAPEAQPPSRLPPAEPPGPNPQEIAARMRAQAQQRAAQEPAPAPQQTTAPAVQPPVPAPGSGRTGGDLAPAPATDAAKALPTPDEAPTESATEGNPVSEIPVSGLALSQDVPQFKSGASEDTGVVEPLGGTFDRRGVGPIQVWRRKDGRMEVISGRHRLDLARRSGEKTIPAQVYDESAGFNADQAAILDAELNIRDGQGKVKDYVQYFQSGITEKEAESRGLLARSTGRRAYAIATAGSPELIAAHQADRLSDEAAVQVAQAAPKNEALQNLGMKLLADGRPINIAVNTMHAAKAIRGPAAENGDLFGFDDSAIQDAIKMAGVAAREQRSLSERIAAIRGASKRPELARKEGVDVRDPKALEARLRELNAEKARWDNWSSHSDLVAKAREEAGLEALPEHPAAHGDFALEQPLAGEDHHEAPASQSGLFAPPTGRELAADAQRRKDAERNGLGRDLVRPEQGDGELLAGEKPAQARVDEAPKSSAASEPADAAEQLSRDLGEQDAQERGFRDAIGKVMGAQANRVEFVHDIDGLPENLRRGVQNRGKRYAKDGGKATTAAVYDPTTQRVFLITSALKSPDRAVWNALHEIAGHDGLRKLLGDKLDRALEIALQNPTVAALAKSVASERNIDTKTQRGRMLAAEEALAELAAAAGSGNFDYIDNRYGVDVPEGVRVSLQRSVENFLRRLRDMLNDLFGRPVFTDEDVRALLDAAREASRREGDGAPGDSLQNTEPAPQTDTPAFKAWFGDSKVVDADGKPLVVYHGSNQSFDRFDEEMLGAHTKAASATAFFFTNDADEGSGYSDLAAKRMIPDSREHERKTDDLMRRAKAAERRGDWNEYERLTLEIEDHEFGAIHADPAGAQVYPVYLSMQNPLRTHVGGMISTGAVSDLIKRARAEGRDGLILEQIQDGPTMGGDPTTHFVVFRPEQIKSASGNRGTFDPSNPSILESVEPDYKIAADDTGRSIVEAGRLLSLIDAAKAAGGDLSALTEAVKNRDTDALHKAIDDLLPSLRPKPRVTGVKNAVTDAEREAAGRSPILADAIKSNESAVADALRALKADPNIGAETIAKLSRAGVEGITLADEAVLLVHKTDLLNKREAAAKKIADPGASEDAKAVARQAWEAAEAEIAALDIAAKNSGREWGRFGQFRQRMLREDFTLAAMERKERVRLERPLTAEEHATIKAMADTIAQLQKRVDDLQARVANSESEWAYEHMARRAPTRGGNRLASLRHAADEARRRLRANQGVPSRRGQSGAIISPTVFYDLSVIGAYHVANGAAKLADWVRAMRADVGDWFDGLKDDHGNIFGAAKREAARHTADKFDVSPADVLAGIDKDNISPKDVRKLIAAHVGAGLRGEQAVIAAAAKDLGLAEDEVRALFVQSVPRGAQSLSEAQQELSDLRKLVRLQAEIDRLEAGRPKPEPGKPQQDSPAVAERKAELADLRNRLRPVRDPEGRYQEMRGKQIARRIAELQARIEAGDFAKRVRVPRALNEANERAMYELDKAKEDFLRHQFEDNLRRRTPLAKAWGLVADTFNLARSVMTSFDLSAVLRQGGFIAYGHPLRALSSIGPSLKAFVREANEHAVNTEINNRRNAPLYKKYGLQLTGIGAGPLTQIEEAYASRWLSKLPWWTGAGVVRGSGRAYVSFLNKLRADTFDAMAATLARGVTLTDAEGKAIANYVNVATGRGKAVGGENAAQALNTVFFAPRLVASRFQLLGGQPLYGGSARTRNLIAQDYARFAIGVSVTIALAAFALGAGNDDDEKPLIGLDPRSASFLKIRVGDTYIDPMTGLAQVSTFLAREATGETVTGAGKVKPLRTGYTLTDLRRALGADIPAHKMAKDGSLPFGSGNAADVLGRFLRTKLAPVPGAIINTLAGSDVIGNPQTPAGTARELVTPMTFQNIADIMAEHGIPKGTAIEVLGLLGMGIQQRQESNADQFTAFNVGLQAVHADVKDRLAKLPPDQWPAALDALKKQYGPAMEGVELDTYKDDYTDKAGNFHESGSPKMDKAGKPRLKSERIADEATYRKAGHPGDGDQVHHIIPDNLVRHHPLMARARALGYDLDNPDNLLPMPAKAGGAIAHNTDHPEYDAEVFGALQAAEKRLRREYGPLDKAPRDKVLDAVHKVEADMRARIQRRDVPTKDGRLAVADVNEGTVFG